jgi:hypothetical protein
MLVSWPLDKRDKLALFIHELLADHTAGRPSTPQSVSHVLGLVQHAALVSPLGVYCFLRLQHFFNDCISSVSSQPKAL